MILESKSFSERVESLLVEFIEYKPGHKNSKGESSPWVIVSHEEPHRIISSHKTKKEAKKHLQQIQFFKHKKRI